MLGAERATHLSGGGQVGAEIAPLAVPDGMGIANSDIKTGLLSR